MRRAGIWTSAVCALGLTALWAGSAAAAGVTEREAAAALEQAGATVEVPADAEDLVAGEIDGYAFVLTGFDCDPDGRCADYVFNAYFDVAGTVTLQDVNAFNEAAIAGRAYLEEGGAVDIEHMFTLSEPDADLIARNLEVWRALLAEFDLYLQSLGRGADAGPEG